MKFEKINAKKFSSFKGFEIAYPQAVYGGYPGETNNSDTQMSDQIKASGGVDSTAYGSGVPNDGFS